MPKNIKSLLLLLILLPFSAHAAVTEVTTKTGLKAWLLEDHSLPIITMSFAFDGGAALDIADKEGLSTLLASTLDEGAGDMPSRAFQAALSERSISLSFSADEDAIYGNLKSLTAEQANAFGLLRMALRQPRFDDEAVSRMKEAMISRRQYGLGDPNWLASQAFEEIALSGHPYGAAAGGTLASIAGLGKTDLDTAAKTRLVRDRLSIAVVGDITPADLARRLDEAFGDLPEAHARIELPELKVQGAGEVALIERNQPQTMLLIGAPGVRREDPDWFPALAMSYILGGDFQSRLMNEIRIRRGLTYGISTALVPHKAGGVLYAMASADNAKVGELLQSFKDEWRRMAEGGVTDQELADAKTYLTGAFALQFGESDGIASVLLEVQRLGFPATYLETRADQINAVTSADVARVAANLLKTENLTIIAVGKPEGITPTRTMSIKP